MTKKIYLLDTDVLITYSRARSEDSRRWFRRIASGDINAGISFVTNYEMLLGVRNEKESNEYEKLISPLQYFKHNNKIDRITADIFRPFKEDKSKQHLVMDAFNAATAQYYRADILTNNIRHFKLFKLDGVELIPLIHD